MSKVEPELVIRIVFLGDSGSGKSETLNAYRQSLEASGTLFSRATDTEDGNPSEELERWEGTYTVDGDNLRVHLLAGSIQESRELMQDANVIVLMFSVASPLQLQNLHQNWSPLLAIAPEPLSVRLLVGTRCHYRSDPALKELFDDKGLGLVTERAANAAVKDFGCVKYMECTNTKPETLIAVVEEAVKQGVKKRKHRTTLKGALKSVQQRLSDKLTTRNSNHNNNPNPSSHNLNNHHSFSSSNGGPRHSSTTNISTISSNPNDSRSNSGAASGLAMLEAYQRHHLSTHSINPASASSSPPAPVSPPVSPTAQKGSLVNLKAPSHTQTSDVL